LRDDGQDAFAGQLEDREGAILPHFVELDLAIAASAEDNLDSFHEINLKLSSLLAVPLPVRLRGFP